MKRHTSTIDNSRVIEKKLKVDLDELIKIAPSLSQNDLEQAKDKLMEQIASTGRLSHRIAEKIDEGITLSKIYTAENPIKVLGIAVGLGVIALRSYRHFSIAPCAYDPTPYDDCSAPNVWCYAGPDSEGNQQPDRCCDPGCCPGPSETR